MLRKNILLNIIIVFSFYLVTAQGVIVERSKQVEIIGGTKYYIHKVEKGQTLFSIAKAYQVKVDDILRYNPETQSSLSVGQIIKIPFQENIGQLKGNVLVDSSLWIEHVVKVNESLFSIAKNYNNSISDIFRINPGLTEHIIPGQVIKIPVNSKDININRTDDTDYTMHKVKDNETLYSIAKYYLVSIEDIKAINPTLDEKIKKGQIIRIPVKKRDNNLVLKEEKNKVVEELLIADKYCSSPLLSNIYNVGLFIPFFLDKSSEVYVPNDENGQYNFKSLNFIEFYEGALLAADTMKAQGMNLKIYIYDDPNDSIYIQNTLKQPEIKKFDLIIGPFYKSSFDVANEFADKHNINIVNPFSPRESIIKNKPTTFKMFPSIYSEYLELADYITTEYTQANVIIVNNNTNDDLAKESEYLKQSIIDAYKKQGAKDNLVKIINYYNVGMNGISDNLKSGCINIIITLATGEVFYTNYIRDLKGYADNYDIILFTKPYLLKYESLELEYLQQLKLHIFSPNYIDYNLQAVNDFINKFHEKYYTEPDLYAFMGYDITFYFLRALYKYGRNFKYCLKDDIVEGLCSKFKFISQDKDSGYENRGIYIYKIDEDYKLVKIK